MFWSGNYISVKVSELNTLLKDENVTLKQVLDVDDLLQECLADNNALIQFLTRPEVLSELISLITEEPAQDVDLSSQYKYAHLACEVLDSQISQLSDRLSLDTELMNRLFDFINKEPPLNPLLASYFSKAIAVLLDRQHKQDWCLYHIVGLRVLDAFRSRTDFLPNLLRHMSTSAIADVFRSIIRLNSIQFHKHVIDWLDEHQFLERIIQIVCCTYNPEEFNHVPHITRNTTEVEEKGEQEASEKVQRRNIENDSNDTCTNVNVSSSDIINDESNIDIIRNHHEDEAPKTELQIQETAIAEQKVGVKKLEITPNKDDSWDDTTKDNVVDSENIKSQVDDSSHKEDNIVNVINEDNQTIQEVANKSNKINVDTPTLVITSEGNEIKDLSIDSVVIEQTRKDERTILEINSNVTEEATNTKANASQEPIKLENVNEEDLKRQKEIQLERMKDMASANATALLVDLIQSGCGAEPYNRSDTSWVLVWRLCSERGVAELLAAASAGPRPGLARAAHLLTVMLHAVRSSGSRCAEWLGEARCRERAAAVEAGVAPHLPLLHQALLKHDTHTRPTGGEVGGVGNTRLSVAALLALLASSELDDVARTLYTLGTPGVLVELFFRHPNNNFLHKEVYSFVRNALANTAHLDYYEPQLLDECRLLDRLMDAFEENEAKRVVGGVRAAYMGHVVELLRALGSARRPPRWEALFRDRLQPLLDTLDTPLGGSYPTEAKYEFAEASSKCETDEVGADLPYYLPDDGSDTNPDDADQYFRDESMDDEMKSMQERQVVNMMMMSIDRFYERPPEDAPAAAQAEGGEGVEWGEGGGARLHMLPEHSPWEGAGSECAPSGEGWAHFPDDVFGPPADPFAPPPHRYRGGGPHMDTMPPDLEQQLSELQLCVATPAERPITPPADELPEAAPGEPPGPPPAEVTPGEADFNANDLPNVS